MVCGIFFFFKQKTAYEMRISDWSSDVCSSDLGRHYTVEMPDGHIRKCFPRGKKAGAAVGDKVIINPQGADEGSIDRILERRNLLYRSDDMRTKQFAANVDQLLVVVAPERKSTRLNSSP